MSQQKKPRRRLRRWLSDQLAWLSEGSSSTCAKQKQTFLFVTSINRFYRLRLCHCHGYTTTSLFGNILIPFPSFLLSLTTFIAFVQLKKWIKIQQITSQYSLTFSNRQRLQGSKQAAWRAQWRQTTSIQQSQLCRCVDVVKSRAIQSKTTKKMFSVTQFRAFHCWRCRKCGHVVVAIHGLPPPSLVTVFFQHKTQIFIPFLSSPHSLSCVDDLWLNFGPHYFQSRANRI